MKIATGLSAGIFWALDTVILGIALSMLPFSGGGQAILLSPFIGAFLHDFCSSVWMLFYTGIKRQSRTVFRALGTRGGKVIMLGALFGGPIGMTGYVFAIRYLGASYTAMISAMFPALGAILSRIFLKERMKKTQTAGFLLSVAGMVLLGYSVKGEAPENFASGLFCAGLCVAGWAAEVVVCAYGMKKESIGQEQALMIRQPVSALVHGILILQVVKGWGLTAEAVGTAASGVIALAALSGTVSYLFYYKTIRRLGASKAMVLNTSYAAWALVFEWLLLQKVPDLKSVLCGILILCGSLAAAYDSEKNRRECDGICRS